MCTESVKTVVLHNILLFPNKYNARFYTTCLAACMCIRVKIPPHCISGRFPTWRHSTYVFSRTYKTWIKTEGWRTNKSTVGPVFIRASTTQLYLNIQSPLHYSLCVTDWSLIQWDAGLCFSPQSTRCQSHHQAEGWRA